MNQADQDFWYARRLATALHANHYVGESPDWEPCPDLSGVLSQIDNMIAGLTRKLADSDANARNAARFLWLKSASKAEYLLARGVFGLDGAAIDEVIAAPPAIRTALDSQELWRIAALEGLLVRVTQDENGHLLGNGLRLDIGRALTVTGVPQ